MKNIYDKLLTKGLSQLKDLEFSNVPGTEEIEYAFSDKYIEKREKLLKKIGRSYWKYVNTAAKKVAVITITLIIAFTSLMTVDAFRESVVNLIYEIYSTFTEVFSTESKDKLHIEKYYSNRNIPEAYSLDSFNNHPRLVTTYWSNDQYYIISLTQTNLSDTHQFNSEHGKLSESIINDTPCLVCVDKDLYYCYWEFDGYRFELIYPIDLGEEFMSEVVGNLVEIDPDELEN